MNKLSTANFKSAVIDGSISFVSCVPSTEVPGRSNIIGLGSDKTSFILATSAKQTDVLHIKNKLTVIKKLRELGVSNALVELESKKESP